MPKPGTPDFLAKRLIVPLLSRALKRVQAFAEYPTLKNTRTMHQKNAYKYRTDIVRI
jgi:hypothetical protein